MIRLQELKLDGFGVFEPVTVDDFYSLEEAILAAMDKAEAEEVDVQLVDDQGDLLWSSF